MRTVWKKLRWIYSKLNKLLEKQIKEAKLLAEEEGGQW
jgi:hypothetical protein